MMVAELSHYLQIENIAPRAAFFIVGTEANTFFMSKAGYENAQ